MEKKIIILINSCLLCFFGLWDLLSNELPNLNTTGLFEVFPRVYHIIVSALLLFLYPLLNRDNNLWFLSGFAPSGMVTICTVTLLISETDRNLSLSFVLVSNLVMNLFSIYFLSLKPTK